MAGVTRLQYTTEIKIIRVMCTGRVDLSFLLRAFIKGADGVLIGGCWPGECHYVTEGNYDALGNMLLFRKMLEKIQVDPERLRIEWIAASEGVRFAEVMDDFVKSVKKIGPISSSQGNEDNRLEQKLEAINRLIPYIKLVERQKLRVPIKSEEEYIKFYNSENADRLFKDLIGEKLTISQILVLLGEKPRTTSEISEILKLNPSEVEKHMAGSSKQGLVRYNETLKSFTLALTDIPVKSQKEQQERI